MEGGKMKKPDRFLIGIAVGVVILIGAAVAIVLLPSKKPSYQPDDTPEGVAHNYLLALDMGDYERAYGYLSPTLPGYPESVEVFTDDVEESWSFQYDRDAEITLAVEAVRTTGDRSTVSIRRTVFYRGELFDSGQYSWTFEMTLRRQDGLWKAVDADRYWDDCWSHWSQYCR
jgi:hypothetical protein